MSKRPYLLAIMIAILVASMLPLTGFAASPATTGQAGFGLSTIRKIDNADAISKGMAGSALHTKLRVAAVNTGNQQNSETTTPVELAIADVLEEVIVSEDVVSDGIVSEDVVSDGIVPTAAVISSPTISTPTFISLSNFTQQVNNGNAGQITGIYSDNLFALAVVQQPSGQAGYVSTAGNTATQFGMASGLGFLAHNYLSGSLFSYLYGGAPITVVYGDGHTQAYQVSQIRKFQALSPESPYSDFVDLASGSTLSATDLFYATYGVGGQVVLQTCISANGNSSWGRLFIIATPAG
jgi:hypothetical protein